MLSSALDALSQETVGNNPNSVTMDASNPNPVTSHPLSESDTLANILDAKAIYFMAVETQCHMELIKKGFQPCFDIDLLKDVFRDPHKPRLLLEPWQKYPRSQSIDCGVFQTHLQRCNNFLSWRALYVDQESCDENSHDTGAEDDISNGMSDGVHWKVCWTSDQLEKAAAEDRSEFLALLRLKRASLGDVPLGLPAYNQAVNARLESKGTKSRHAKLSNSQSKSTPLAINHHRSS
ncbi:hypothetical protein B0T22DRAFT_518773 [Podospora appendiculata]|uniref:Uncharacterized protein n=1 Tax=Podospora appendiculata TaxID=314037 RepID=A0AAE0X6P5_9PEZI|nr:hypothetical protein B0T22DRAFT_518773 [Podospora appendiculata]